MKKSQEIVDHLVSQANEAVGYATEAVKPRNMLAQTYAALALIEAALWAMRDKKEKP